MKILILLVLLSSCTHYTTTSLSEDKVIVSKTTNILWLYGGTIFTCKKDDRGMIANCRENVISGKQVSE